VGAAAAALLVLPRHDSRKAAARSSERLSYITSSGQVELLTVDADGSLTNRRIIGPVSAAAGVTVHALSASSNGKWLAWLEEPKTAVGQGAPTTTVVVRSTDAVSPPLTGNVQPGVERIGFTGDRVVAIDYDQAESSPLSSPLNFAKLATPAITLDVLNAVSSGLLVLTSPPGNDAQSLTQQVTLVGSDGSAVIVHGFPSQSYAEPVLTSTNAVTPAGDELLLEQGDHTDFCGVGPSSDTLLVDLPGGVMRPLGHPGSAGQQWRLQSATFAGSSPAGVADYNKPPTVNTYISTRTGWQLAGDGTYGRPTSLPWGMTFPHGVVPTDVPVHPTPLYEALAAVLIAAILWALGKSWNPAAVFGAYLALSGISRFLVEYLRINEPALLGLTQPQLWALASLIVGVVLIVRTQYLNRPRPIPAETPGAGEAVTARSDDAVTARSTP
jgi:hypothetical protein